MTGDEAARIVSRWSRPSGRSAVHSSQTKEAGLMAWLRGVFAKNPSRGEARDFLEQTGSMKWDTTFASRVKDPQFVQSVIQLSDDPKLKQHVRSMHQLENGQVLANIEGSTGKKYDVKRLPGGKLGCTCNDWRYNGAHQSSYQCKHIRAYKEGKLKVGNSSFDDSMKAFSDTLSKTVGESLYQHDQSWKNVLGDPAATQSEDDLLVGEGAHTGREYTEDANSEPGYVAASKWAAFRMELEKSAGKLTRDEQDRLDRQYTLIGAASLPAVGMVSNLISRGKPFPAGTKPLRYLAGQTAGGAILAGAIPALRERLKTRAEEQSDERRRQLRISQGLKEQLTPPRLG